MGWQREGHGAHEGYVVGYVLREGCQSDSRLYRELQYMPMSAVGAIENDNIGPGVIQRIGAGCECGWRSSHLEPRDAVEWMPHIVLASERDEDRAHALWDEHIVGMDRTTTGRDLVLHMYKRIDESKDFAYQVGFGSQTRKLLVDATRAFFPDERRDKIGDRLAAADEKHWPRTHRRRA